MTRRAAELRARFDESFWDEELGTYALALDGEKRPCRVRTSNAGHALFTGIAAPLARGPGGRRPDAAVVLLRLGRPHHRHHRGALQPDELPQRLGLAARQRADRRRAWRATAAAPGGRRVFRGLFEAAVLIDLRLPELFCGFPRGRGRGPTLYPVACSPQAWAASATPFTLIEASLGLQFDPAANEIHLHNPSLPSFLDEVVIRNLQLKESSVDLKVRRHAHDVSVEILERRGNIQVSIVFGRAADPGETGSPPTASI